MHRELGLPTLAGLLPPDFHVFLAHVDALQHPVEQLKLEASGERIKVSQVAAELHDYCMQNTCKDALLVGVPEGSNPFQGPRTCVCFMLKTGKVFAKECLQAQSYD